MPTIDTIKPKNRRRERFILEFRDSREPVELDAEVLARACLAEGREIAERELAALLAEDERQRCRTRAWSLLSHRQRTRAELRRALRKRKFPADVVDGVLARIEELGHLNDQSYAAEFASQYAASGKAGPLLVKQKLQARGVDAAIIEQALDPVRDGDTQKRSALALLEKWNRRPKPDDPQKRRVAAASFLARRGFDGDIVWDAVRTVLGDGNDSG